MDKLDKDLLKLIEKALNITFKEWQINYIFDIPMILDMKVAHRGSGKTTAYIIKTLFADERAIRIFDMRDMELYSDMDPAIRENTIYNQWFKGQLYRIYMTLIGDGIYPRIVLFTREDEQLYNQYKENYYEVKNLHIYRKK